MAGTALRALAVLPLASGLSVVDGGARAAEAAPTGRGPEGYQLSWYRDCGCSGFAIEAVYLLLGMVDLIGADRVRTNPCPRACSWPSAIKSVIDSITVRADPYIVGRPGESSNSTRVLVVHRDACSMPKWARPAYTERGVLRVSRSMFETDRIDEGVAGNCNRDFDAVWVPSEYNVNTFARSNVSEKKLRVLHEALDPAVFNCRDRTEKGSKEFKFQGQQLDRFMAEGRRNSSFTFLSVFKWEKRKNPFTLIETFVQTFPPHGETPVDGAGVAARLLVHTDVKFDPTTFEVYMANLPHDVQEAISVGRLLISTDSIPTEEVAELYSEVDAFVLPTHGEGWGLPLAEAMAFGLPVIATGWGGQTEFMNSNNSYLLGYSMESAWTEHSPWQKDHMWAKPDADKLQQTMLSVVQHQDEARMKGTRACEDSARMFAPEALARRTNELVLELIGGSQAT